MKKRSMFNLDYTRLFSCDTGYVVPIGLKEVYPGDTFRHKASMLLRVTPLLAPVMHKVDIQVDHFFVPTRIVWDDFEKFITGGPTGTDNTEWPHVLINSGSGEAVGSLADYLGIPPSFDDIEYSAIPFRGYNLIFNEFYRDEDLMTEATISRGNGLDTTTSRALKRAAWNKDYFTILPLRQLTFFVFELL